MISYSYKDVKMQIGGEELYCSDMSISYSTELVSSYNLKSESSFEYHPSRSPFGALDFSYYMTGADPLVSHITSHKNPITFNLGGYTFQSGFLNKYSMNLSPNSYVKINAGISFFEKINNSFSPASSSLGEADILRVGGIRLSDNVYVLEDQVLSLTYSYNVAVNPIYSIDHTPSHQEKRPHRISFGQKKVSSSVTIHKHDLDLPVTGLHEQFKIKLNDKNGSEKQSYVINGRLTSKKASVSAGGRLTNEINIRQASLGVIDSEKMTITSFSPTSGNRYYPGVGALSAAPAASCLCPDRVGITGTNFTGVEKVLLGDYEMKISGAYTNTVITGIVPKSIPSNYAAPIRVVGQGDIAMSDGTFLVVSGATL